MNARVIGPERSSKKEHDAIGKGREKSRFWSLLPGQLIDFMLDSH